MYIKKSDHETKKKRNHQKKTSKNKLRKVDRSIDRENHRDELISW